MGREFFDISMQMRSFGLSVAVGICIGIVYDLFRIMRLASVNNKYAVVVQDVVFWCFAAIVSFLFGFVVNNGTFRFYFAVGEALGFAFYYFTFGAAVIKMSAAIVKGLKKLFKAVFRVLTFPFKRIYRVFSPKFKQLFKITKKRRIFFKNKRKFSLKRNRVLLYNNRHNR